MLAGGARSRPIAEAGDAEALNRAAEAPESRPPSLGDFLLDEDPIGTEEPYLLRPRTPRWSEEQVARYWVPVRDIVLDIVSGLADRRMDELFEDVP